MDESSVKLSAVPESTVQPLDIILTENSNDTTNQTECLELTCDPNNTEQFSVSSTETVENTCKIEKLSLDGNCVFNEASENEQCIQLEVPPGEITNRIDTPSTSFPENDINIDEIEVEKIPSTVEVVVLDDESTSFDVPYDFHQIPLQITGAWMEFKHATKNNYTRGCKWAPDGSCILTCSDDNILRLFNLPHQLWNASQWQDITEMESVVKISEGGLIYDYCWYPLMNSEDPRTCCLVSSSKDSPVHLWDGFSGELRCSYRTYNFVDEIVAAHSLGFDVDGQRLFCGFDKVVRIFNIDVPGRKYEERHVFAKKSGQSGIISCFAFTSANQSISAAGSYGKTIGLYSEPSGELEHLLEGQKGGVTQIQFSPDGTLLYSGGRKDCEIFCWDLRNLGCVLYSLQRSCITNQRMYFDVTKCGRYVISGNQNGVITIWDVTKEPKTVNFSDFEVMEPIQYFLAHEDCVNGISIHPYLPLLCSSSGQRKFPNLLSEEEDDIFSPEIPKHDNSLRLWWIGKSSDM